MYERRKPTPAQIDYARELIQETRTDPEWCDLERMNRHQVQDLIDSLRYELEAKRQCSSAKREITTLGKSSI